MLNVEADPCYKVRRSGTNEFVSGIVPAWEGGGMDPDCREESYGLVYFVEGWDNPDAMVWKNLEDAKIAKKEVWKIEGFNTVVEEVAEYFMPFIEV
jgi:hypothetical protein